MFHKHPNMYIILNYKYHKKKKVLDSFRENCRDIYGHLEEVTFRLRPLTPPWAPELISGPAVLGDKLLVVQAREGRASMVDRGSLHWDQEDLGEPVGSPVKLSRFHFQAVRKVSCRITSRRPGKASLMNLL